MSSPEPNQKSDSRAAQFILSVLLIDTFMIKQTLVLRFKFLLVSFCFASFYFSLMTFCVLLKSALFLLICFPEKTKHSEKTAWFKKATRLKSSLSFVAV